MPQKSSFQREKKTSFKPDVSYNYFQGLKTDRDNFNENDETGGGAGATHIYTP
jgi:hypothetical protein